MVQMSLTEKKADYVFEKPLNIYMIVRWLFLSSIVDSRKKQSQVEKNI